MGGFHHIWKVYVGGAVLFRPARSQNHSMKSHIKCYKGVTNYWWLSGTAHMWWPLVWIWHLFCFVLFWFGLFASTPSARMPVGEWRFRLRFPDPKNGTIMNNPESWWWLLRLFSFLELTFRKVLRYVAPRINKSNQMWRSSTSDTELRFV